MKKLDRAKKLLAVVREGSGSTEAERTSAALEVCRMLNVGDVNLMVIAYEQPKDVPSVVVSGTKSIFDEADFSPARAFYDTHCTVEDCGGPIFANERCWKRMRLGIVEHVHADCWTK